jgi:hypothetical protein
MAANLMITTRAHRSSGPRSPASAVHYASASNSKSLMLSTPLSEMVESGDGKLFTQSIRK